MESELSGVFQLKMVTKNSVWVPGDPTQSCFCCMMSLFEETCKLSEPNSYTEVFSLFNSTVVSFMWKECHFL